MRSDLLRLGSLLRLPKARLALVLILAWQLYGGLGTAREALTRLPVERFQPEAAPPPPSSTVELPLLRWVAERRGEDRPVTDDALDLNRLFAPPPAEARRPEPTPIAPPPAVPAAPIDYATMLQQRITLQALSGRGAVINQRFVPWGGELPLQLPSTTGEASITPRLVGGRRGLLRISVAGEHIKVPVQ